MMETGSLGRNWFLVEDDYSSPRCHIVHTTSVDKNLPRGFVAGHSLYVIFPKLGCQLVSKPVTDKEHRITLICQCFSGFSQFLHRNVDIQHLRCLPTESSNPRHCDIAPPPSPHKKPNQPNPSIPHTPPQEMIVVKDHWLRPIGIYFGTELCVYRFFFVCF